MTFLEVVGAVALVMAAAGAVRRVIHKPEPLISMSTAEIHMGVAIRDAFQAGMLCAADIVTHSGNEALAGDIRKTVEYVRLNGANDNRFTHS
jgi:hypothetical protein